MNIYTFLAKLVLAIDDSNIKVKDVLFYFALVLTNALSFIFYVPELAFKINVIASLIFGVLVGVSLVVLFVSRILIKSNCFGGMNPPSDHYGFFKHIEKVPSNAYYVIQMERNKLHSNNPNGYM